MRKPPIRPERDRRMHALHTTRLRMRPIEERDEALYVALYSDEATMQFVGPTLSAAGARRSFQSALRTVSASPARFVAIEDAMTGARAGLCGLTHGAERAPACEFGILLTAAARGRGFGFEASVALIDFAFATLPIDAVRVQYHRANAAAARLFERIGLRPVPGAASSASCVRTTGRDDWFYRAAHNRGE